MLGGGAIAVILYRRNADQPIVPTSLGFRTGAITGVIAFAVNAIAAVLKLVTGGGANERQALRDTIEKSIERSSGDAQAVEMMRRMGDWMQTPQGFAVMFTLGLFMVGLAFILFTGLGGALGSVLFGKKSEYR
jgi:hypothetical protein